MNLRLRRIEKIEEALASARKDHYENLKKRVRLFPIQAHLHATALAAIVLSGKPKIDEPLKYAWSRALQHYGINLVGSITSWKGQVEAAQRLFPIIMEGKNRSERFTEIFMAAPVWLLQFSAMPWDARVLKFQLPNLPQIFKWGTTGFEDMRRWPLLPLGTMMAGDPISNSDLGRRVCITFLCQIMEPLDLEDLLVRTEEELFRADEENCEGCATMRLRYPSHEARGGGPGRPGR
jgi:hypothetical protein